MPAQHAELTQVTPAQFFAKLNANALPNIIFGWDTGYRNEWRAKDRTLFGVSTNNGTIGNTYFLKI